MLKKKGGEAEAKTKNGALEGGWPGIGPVLALAAVIVMIMQYTRLDEPKKRFIIYLARQVPYLPGRYYV
jgi:hypothetical protein